mgnify:CR=1 FL=1
MKAADLRSLQRGLGRLLGVQLLKKVQSGFRVDSLYKNKRKASRNRGMTEGVLGGATSKRKNSAGRRES